MNNLYNDMKSFFLEKDVKEEWFEQRFSSSVGIASMIGIYSHRDQFRLNGEAYFEHPLRCYELYDSFVGITPNDYFCIDKDLMSENGIPFEGVQEVCLLHDVLEDTTTTIDDIADVYKQFGLETYFDLYIKNPLLLITHDKSESYTPYIQRLLKSPIASLCKMIDMVDNMNVLGLNKLEDFELERIIKYLSYIKIINDKWHFIENVMKYKELFDKSKQKT